MKGSYKELPQIVRDFPGKGLARPLVSWVVGRSAGTSVGPKLALLFAEILCHSARGAVKIILY